MEDGEGRMEDEVWGLCTLGVVDVESDLDVWGLLWG